MPIIVDAWNFIRCECSPINDEGRDALEAADDLVRYFADFQRSHHDPVVLVFDSKNEHLGLDHANTDTLKIVATKNADTYIKRYIDRTPERQRRNMRVVSSDNEVYYYAKSSFATPIRSDAFWEKLQR